ncbi:MAG TPA: hypothetical protein VGS41_18220, partial [Chthonomonadales bacterium]|nr:hypothetical protein [Chthonomonadales bacterium]
MMKHTPLRRSAAAAFLAAAAVLAMQPANAAPNPRVQMVVENRGSIVIELLPKAAPKTVDHFLKL